MQTSALMSVPVDSLEPCPTRSFQQLRFIRLSLHSAVAAVALGAFSLPVQAESEADTWAIEEITVTAQKREQNLQDVGTSVSWISGLPVPNCSGRPVMTCE